MIAHGFSLDIFLFTFCNPFKNSDPYPIFASFENFPNFSVVYLQVLFVLENIQSI